MTVTVPRYRLYTASLVAAGLMAVAIVVAAWAFVRASQTSAEIRRSARQTQVNAEQTHQALCTFRKDLENRADSTEHYLATHTAKVILGVPRGTFVQNLKNQRRTLASLDSLRCL